MSRYVFAIILAVFTAPLIGVAREPDPRVLTRLEASPAGDRTADGEVVTKQCDDWFVADGPKGFFLLEWWGGYSPSKGDAIDTSNLDSYGFKDVNYPGHSSGRVWVDDYLLSKTSALEKLLAKCQ